jgi:mRNA-degrading endonuclease toxin of MazEF toxin-antitoxin module
MAVALGPVDGLPRACVLNLDTPELVLRSLFVERIARLSSARMDEVCRALAAATGC